MRPLEPTPAPNADEAPDLRRRFARHLALTVPGEKPIVVDRASGCTLRTLDGRVYLDMNAGIAVANVGHCHPDVVAAVAEQVARYAHVNVYGRFTVPEQLGIAERLASVAPAGLDVAFLTSTGTEANEGALKLTRKATGRPRFIAFERAFHGRTFGSLSVSWKEAWRTPFEPLLEEVTFVPYDDLDALAAAMGDDVAAVIVEPVQGEGGVRVPSAGFLPGVRQLCDDHGALLIADEVQGAMGRSGRWFSIDHVGVVPDVITLAKALGGGLPLGAILASEELFATFLDPPLSHLTTFGGNPVSCAAAIAAFDVIRREGLVEAAAAQGEYLLDRLRSLQQQFPEVVTDVRGIGLWCAIDLAPPELAQKLVVELERRGVLVGSLLNSSGTIRIAPPLIVTAAEIDVLIGALRTSLAHPTRWSA